jgi:hypothetical protein
VFFLSAREDIFLSGAVTLRRADLANILIYVLSFTVGLGTLKRDVLNVNARCVLQNHFIQRARFRCWSYRIYLDLSIRLKKVLGFLSFSH